MGCSYPLEAPLVHAGVSALGLLPANRACDRYDGSPTIPRCTESVRWIAKKHAMTASKAQIAQFRAALGFENNRPVQPVHARPLLR